MTTSYTQKLNDYSTRRQLWSKILSYQKSSHIPGTDTNPKMKFRNGNRLKHLSKYDIQEATYQKNVCNDGLTTVSALGIQMPAKMK